MLKICINMVPKVRFMRNIWLVNMHLVCVLLISCGDDETANSPGGGPNDGTSSEAVGFITADGVNISAVLRIPEGLIASTPAVILIHSEGKDKSEWVGSSFFNTLIDENFIFLAFDIRLTEVLKVMKVTKKIYWLIPDGLTRI